MPRPLPASWIRRLVSPTFEHFLKHLAFPKRPNRRTWCSNIPLRAACGCFAVIVPAIPSHPPTWPPCGNCSTNGASFPPTNSTARYIWHRREQWVNGRGVNHEIFVLTSVRPLYQFWHGDSQLAPMARLRPVAHCSRASGADLSGPRRLAIRQLARSELQD